MQPVENVNTVKSVGSFEQKDNRKEHNYQGCGPRWVLHMTTMCFRFASGVPIGHEPAQQQIREQNAIQPIETWYKKYNTLSLLIGVLSGLIFLIITADRCRQCFNKLENKSHAGSFNKIFWVYGKNVDSGYLKEVFTILQRFGYRNKPNSSDWDLLWAHDYPFRNLYPQLNNLKQHQKVNHFPGCGYITNKVDLATSGLKYIPPAFKLPGDKEKLIEYSKKFSNISFVQKKNDHRNIQIKRIEEIDLDKEGNFVQEYVDKPLLINGHKFDIGIYTVITSVDPLRVYVYNGEALLRFCPVKYYPFDPNNLDKYVVGDDYLPIWEVPALDYYYNKLGLSMRDSLNTYLQEQGRDPSVIWEQIEDSIRTIVLAKEPLILNVLKSSFSSKPTPVSSSPVQYLHQEKEMIVSDKNIATFPKACSSDLCRTSCVSSDCQLCKPCLSPETRQYLEQAYMEHLHKGDCKRVFPPSMVRLLIWYTASFALVNFNNPLEVNETPAEAFDVKDLDNYSAENRLHFRWFQGKCQLDSSWCF
ncbi:hypothetical protein NQ317_001352 [Molorchus minor]|uniref:Tubulin polyglutamylase TTLL6 n=1 Tax=Molorchus minor TaxID=1323400 RepID=A0ABQ9JN28_9CUCU|nr:hypothetical protein NQ317_001352 [Molorchus minor]